MWYRVRRGVITILVVAVVSATIGAVMPFEPTAAWAATSRASRGVRICKPALDRTALLAQELGISTEELRAAQERAKIAAVQRAVELGRLDAQRAELRIAAIKLRSFMDPQAAAAQALGMTPEELQAACDEGQSLRDLIEARDMTPREFARELRDALDAQVQQAVDEGIITQEQAERLKKWAARKFAPRRGLREQQGRRFHRGRTDNRP